MLDHWVASVETCSNRTVCVFWRWGLSRLWESNGIPTGWALENYCVGELAREEVMQRLGNRILRRNIQEPELSP